MDCSGCSVMGDSMKVPKRRDPKMPVEEDDEDEDEGWYLRGSGCVVF
jgi:hypothetical protein